MDAIIYFYKTREETLPKISLMYRDGYLLAKVGICGSGNSWFGAALPKKPYPPEEPTETWGRQENPERRKLAAWFRPEGRRRRREKKAAWQEYKRKKQEYEGELQIYDRKLEEIQEGVSRLAWELTEALDAVETVGDACCVYEDSLSFLTDEKNPISLFWTQCFQFSQFREYTELSWVLPLLKEAKGPHFVLLGTAACIPKVLEYCARRMKSLRWFLSEKETTEEIRDIVEDFYQDSGLAITLRPLEGRPDFRFMGLESGEPVCVLDFSTEKRVYGDGLAAGSIWFDFTSLEEKERRLARFGDGIRYVSVKKRWRLAKRESQIETNFTTSGNTEIFPVFL